MCELQLGIPDFSRSLPPQSTVYDSRIGGIASYFARAAAEAPPPHPCCALCGRPLFLLLQLYAPAEERERSLLLYGCNASACGGGPGAWVARRTQGGPVAGAGSEAGGGAEAAPPAEPADPWGAASAWDGLSGDCDGDSVHFQPR